MYVIWNPEREVYIGMTENENAIECLYLGDAYVFESRLKAYLFALPGEVIIEV